MIINYKNIYYTNTNGLVLILYSISGLHYIGIPVYKDKIDNSIHIKSLNFYFIQSEIQEYKYSDFINILYIKGKVASITKQEFNDITHIEKNYLLSQIQSKIKDNSKDNLLYAKWTNDIIDLNLSTSTTVDKQHIKARGIYWVNFGIGVGSELRKLRPAILWRYTSNKEICTFIPLTSKHFNDKYDFHYDLTCIKNSSTSKIECIQNLSSKRIYAPYISNGHMVYINNEDFNSITLKIVNFYTYS